MKNIKTFEGFWDFLKSKTPVKKTLHSQELFVIKRKIRDFCDRLNIQNYTINNDGTVDVNGELRLDLSLLKKDELNNTIINFNKVNGSVDMTSNKKGINKLPFTFKEVTGSFFITHKNLETLLGCPKKVGGNFNCRNNRLRTLEGAPEYVGGNFYVSDNSLGSLQGAPKYIGGDFDISENSLETLEGLPERIGGFLELQSNKIKSLEYINNNCNIRYWSLEQNPIMLIFELVSYEIEEYSSITDIIDFFNSCDPVHPQESGDPILYLNRLELFMSEVLGRELDIRKEIENHHASLYGNHGSIRFLLEYYYDIRY